MNEVNEVLVERRCATVVNCIYYDLKDDSCNVVKVSRDGWEIIKDPPVIFVDIFISNFICRFIFTSKCTPVIF